MSGRVVLVGAGPGDPDLITVAGLKALREADVIVTDRLVPEALLAEAGKTAEIFFFKEQLLLHKVIKKQMHPPIA